MKLILNPKNHSHVAIGIAVELEDAILSDPSQKVQAVRSSERISGKVFSAWSKMERILPQFILKLISAVTAKFLVFGPHYFNVLMTPNWTRCFPYILFPGKKSVYIFDAWPSLHDDIIKVTRSHHFSHVFVSSSQVVERLEDMIERPVFSWVPEGIDSHKYKFLDYHEKDIEVLELGRKYEIYHNHIVEALRVDGRMHLFEEKKGQLIFPTEKDLIDGLARTKISICVPSNITHPERAGDIETMTVRYLQSMASKCLVVGHAPQEMVELFGYNPVVEIDMEKPAEQIRDILENFTDYIPLIEKNYIETLANHTWNDRWQQIRAIMQSAD